MVSTIILGLGLPSAVCYLLMATLIGPMLTKLGLVPLSAHLFIFYFAVMSAITPPVALAAYAGSALAGSDRCLPPRSVAMITISVLPYCSQSLLLFFSVNFSLTGQGAA